MFQDISTPSQLLPTLWLSGCHYAQQHSALEALGVTAIVNLTPDDYGHAAAGFKTLHIDIDDAAVIDPALVGQFLSQMDTWSATDETILIHCHAGISRTSAFAIAWLMHREGVTADTDLRKLWAACEDQVALARPIIMPHYLLKQAVLTYFLSTLS